MAAELIVRSEIPPISWEEFITTHPLGSIALDGYVGEGPNFDANGPYLNANHHEGVKRLETLSTAQQILMDIRMGLDTAFRRVDGQFSPSVFVNDCDQDVCTAWFLLNHLEQAKAVTNPQLNRFVNVAGTLDATAGAFPYDRDLKILGQLRWVFEPYTRFNANAAEIAKKDNSQYRSIIETVEARIAQHLMGGGGYSELDPRFDVVGGGPGWTMIKEVGKDGKVGAYISGVDAFISVKQIDDERWKYSLGRRSEYIPFPIPDLMEVFNQMEGCTEDRWGGGTTTGGGPRVGASKLSPIEVEAATNDYLANFGKAVQLN